jgi:hypothetical protein
MKNAVCVTIDDEIAHISQIIGVGNSFTDGRSNNFDTDISSEHGWNQIDSGARSLMTSA